MQVRRSPCRRQRLGTSLHYGKRITCLLAKQKRKPKSSSLPRQNKYSLISSENLKMFCKGNWNFMVTQGINIFQLNLQPSVAKQTNKQTYGERARAAGLALRAGLLTQRLPRQVRPGTHTRASPGSLSSITLRICWLSPEGSSWPLTDPWASVPPPGAAQRSGPAGASVRSHRTVRRATATGTRWLAALAATTWNSPAYQVRKPGLLQANLKHPKLTTTTGGIAEATENKVLGLVGVLWIQTAKHRNASKECLIQG